MKLSYFKPTKKMDKCICCVTWVSNRLINFSQLTASGNLSKLGQDTTPYLLQCPQLVPGLRTRSQHLDTFHWKGITFMI